MHAQRTRNIDWIALALFISLVLIGWLMVYAAGYEHGEGVSPLNLSTPSGKQLLFMSIAIAMFVVVNLIDIKFWRTFVYIIYGASMVSLILVLLIGATIKGSTSWFSIGPLSLQPAEFAKFTTCLAMASYLSYYRTDLRKLKYQAGAVAIFSLPALLILLQPDAGSALVFGSFLLVLYRNGMPSVLYIAAFLFVGLFISSLIFPPLLVISLLILLAAGTICAQLKNQLYWFIGFLALGVLEVVLWEVIIPLPVIVLNAALLIIAAYRKVIARQARQVAIVVPTVLISTVLVFGVSYSFTNILEPHQQDRINVWLRPEQCDPQGSLYNVLQSKIAIGSGGLVGKGYLQGSMTNLNYVPEQTTDFIFSTIGEEQGFIGSVGIIVLFTFLLLRIMAMAERMRSDFSRNYTYGVLGLLLFHFFVNIGMTMGLVPIIGIPLPFISYGGSSILAFSIMLGLVFKMDATRYEM